MRIYLLGFMGSGKTTIGQQLARRLGYAFEDLDDLIERKYKTSIPLIFEKYDEQAFRNLETEVLHLTAGFENAVVATGGGTPCYFNNMEWMNKNGLTIYLKMHAGSLTRRIINAKKVRPLIRSKSPEEVLHFVELKLGERESFYEQAHIVIHGEVVDMDEIARSIDQYQKLNNHGYI